MDIEPRSDRALIEWAALAPRGTVTDDDPTKVCVATRYLSDPGTVRVIGPTSVVAVSDPGAAAKSAVIAPASDLNAAVADRRPEALMSPASALALTVPASAVSVMAPAAVDTDTAIPRGTATW